MKNLIVIGGLGYIGFHLLKTIESDPNFHITCIARISKKNKFKAQKFKNIQFVWADITKQNIYPFLQKADIVLNLAAILPPNSEIDPKYSNEINYVFVKKLLEMLDSKTKFIFLSTSGVNFSHATSKNKLFHKNYLMQKTKAEEEITTNAHSFVIIRLPFVFDSHFPSITPSLFEIPLNNKMEFIHLDDVVDCICAAFKKQSNQIINLGGNPQCQITYKEYLRFCFAGYTPTKENLFAQDYYPTDWVCTDNVKQRIGFQTMVEEVQKKHPLMYLYRKLFHARIIKKWEKKSPYLSSGNKTATN